MQDMTNPESKDILMSGETSPYRMVFKQVSIDDSVNYQAVVRNKTGYYLSKTSIKKLAEEFERLAKELDGFKDIPLINHLPADWKYQQERFNKMFKERKIEGLPDLLLVPLDKNEFRALRK